MIYLILGLTISIVLQIAGAVILLKLWPEMNQTRFDNKARLHPKVLFFDIYVAILPFIYLFSGKKRVFKSGIYIYSDFLFSPYVEEVWPLWFLFITMKGILLAGASSLLVEGIQFIAENWGTVEFITASVVLIALGVVLFLLIKAWNYVLNTYYTNKD